MKYLFRAEVAMSSVEDALAPRQYNAYWLDVFLRLASYNRDLKGLRGNATSTHKSSWRTKVKERASILDALGIFLEVLETGAHKFSGVAYPGSSWTSRDRVGLSGIILPGYTFSRSTLGEFFPSEVAPDLVDLPLGMQIGPDGNYVSADDLFDFARAFADLWQEGSTFVWPSTIMNNDGQPPGGIYPGGASHWALSYSQFEVTDEVIRYQVNIHAYAQLYIPPSIWIYSETTYGVTISRQREFPWAIRLQTTEGRGNSQAGGGLYFHPFHSLTVDWGVWQPAIDVTVKTSSRDWSFEIKDFKVDATLSVIRCAPALYHTQSRAFYSLLGKASENFESLVESPDFLPVVYSTLKTLAVEPLAAARLPFVERLRTVTKLVCGAYLAYIFAIAPSLKSARNVWERFVNAIRSTPGEGEIRFEGNAADYSSLPAGLRHWVDAIRPVEIADFTISFRTTLIPSVEPHQLASLVDALLADASRLGLEPDPTYLYQALPFTFVFDMFVPVASLMRDAYQRFKLIHARGIVVGHSISLRVTYSDGLIVHTYVRSDATGIYLDPPMDSWLTAPGASLPVLVPLAMAIIL